MSLDKLIPLPRDITNIIKEYASDMYICFDEKNDKNKKIRVNITKLSCNCHMFRQYRHFCIHLRKYLNI